MKVLMFGWEFPPHISGGLGTACRGLTKSLTREHVEILFVIPKAIKPQHEKNLDIISASEIPINMDRDIEKIIARASPEKETGEYTGMTTLAVPSGLTPYVSEEVLGQPYGWGHWNYRVVKEPEITKIIDNEVLKGVRYPFSGGYGPRLMEEVKWYTAAAEEIARNNSFDVIHAHDWLTFPAGVAARRISGKPLIVHIHATEYDRAGENINPEVYDIERMGMEAADQVIAVSYRTKERIVSRYMIPDEKIEVVHNGIGPRNGAETVVVPPIGKKIVTYLGRVTYQKGPQYFVEAAQRVHQKFPDVHFVMAGSGDMLASMIERVAQLKFSSHFHFTGFLVDSQVERIWSVTNVYVMPSVSEPFGIAPLEAIRAGVPVIISRQSGVSEVVNNAIKVDFWDTEALADAICNLLRFKSLSETLSKKSSAELLKITWDRAAKKTLKLYYELTTKKAVSEPLLSGAPAEKVRPV